MTKDRWYSPRLERQTVRRLYFQAKADGIPMTVLAIRLVEDALGNQIRTSTPKSLEDQNLTKPS